jgi:succinyl-diaminopimelate desuccinylase
MSQEELIAQAKQLIAIPSTADNPTALQDAYQFMVDVIQKSGKSITIERFESNGKLSLLAYRGASRPARFRIIFNGHVDVVPAPADQFKPHVADGNLYGRGAYDMKIASLLMTQVFCEFVDKVPYDLGLQITTDEELSGIDGTDCQIKQGVRADLVICGESGRALGTYEIANEAKGSCAATVTFKGSSAHGAYPWRGDNAAMKAARFATHLHERYPTPAEETEKTTITLTSIVTHNTVHNRVPDTAVATLDMRYIAEDPHFRSEEHVIALLKDIDPAIDSVDFVTFTAPLYTDPQNPLLLSLKASAERIERKPFSFVRRNATSDGRLYGQVGVQACEFGIAGENQHSENEYVPLQACLEFQATLQDFLTKTITSEASRSIDPATEV